MFKAIIICFLGLVAIAAAKPGVVAPLAYTAPVAAAYSAPLGYSGGYYASPYAASYVASPYDASYVASSFSGSYVASPYASYASYAASPYVAAPYSAAPLLLKK